MNSDMILGQMIINHLKYRQSAQYSDQGSNNGPLMSNWIADKKSILFKWFFYYNVWYSDPHCTGQKGIFGGKFQKGFVRKIMKIVKLMS